MELLTQTHREKQMKNYLKVKAMSLASEAKIIRKQEKQRAKQLRHALKFNYTRAADYHDAVRTGLYLHRIGIVREEARATNIAYGFLRNKKYSQIESFTYNPPDWARVEELVMKYAERTSPRYNRPVEEVFKAWKEDAIMYIMHTHDVHFQEETEPVLEKKQKFLGWILGDPWG